MKTRFIHNVYFWLANPAQSEDGAALEKGLRTLEQIETVRDIHIGKPSSTNRPVIDTTYSYHLMLAFDNLEDQNTYQVDPVHLQFVEDCQHLWKKVQIYDSDSGLLD
ncbi:MAG: Dabb family protein [Cyclobacteriaceae bacterium]